VGDRPKVLCRDGTELGCTEHAESDALVVEAVPIRRASVDLFDRLARALEWLERQARDTDVAFAITRDESCPKTLLVDAEKLIWVVSALAGNSLRYVRRGTRLRPGGSIAVHLATAQGELRIRVADDGPGMPEPAAAVLRGDRAAHENAPALALVHDLVAAQGGRVDVRTSQDAFDHGTTVAIALPLAPPGVR
jgi:sensor histidine kinase regulating citrate/malate metabolism